jgi:hypothetical protein
MSHSHPTHEVHTYIKIFISHRLLTLQSRWHLGFEGEKEGSRELGIYGHEDLAPF